MTQKRIKDIIAKYVDNEASESEIQHLLTWLEDPGNLKIFKEYISLNHLVNIKFKKFDSVKAFEKTLATIDEERKVKRISFNRVLKYAAVFIGIVGAAYFFQPGDTTVSGINDEAITLQLNENDVKLIKAGDEQQIVLENGQVVGTQKGNEISYKADSKLEELVYNELKIPYGKTFKVELSDGTAVLLNSGTSLKYPVKFIKGKKREVFLMGEAFFDVTKDAAHPFIVNTNAMDVRVLGTQFNVSSYPNDDVVNTVLVEGSVGLYNEDGGLNENPSAVLVPNEMAIWKKTDNTVMVERVNTSEYTAWMQGKTVFVKKPFKEIIKVLERKYNVVIENQYTLLNDQVFTATFDKENIDQVLKSFSESRLFAYSIKNNKIVITKPPQ